MQLLIWTGTGEPHISRSHISIINNHYQSIGCEDQIGFDCQVSLSHYNIIFTIIVSNVLLPPLPPLSSTYIPPPTYSRRLSLYERNADIQVASTEFSGMFYDNAVRLVGLFWNAKNYILDE